MDDLYEYFGKYMITYHATCLVVWLFAVPFQNRYVVIVSYCIHFVICDVYENDFVSYKNKKKWKNY